MIQDNLQIFDDFEREYMGPSQYSEPQWEYLNRTARPEFQYIRELLQDWFNEYKASSEKRYHLCTGFRSSKDSEHLSAFFELYLHQLFKNQGFEIEIEPELEQRYPDFLLTSSDGTKILLEATGTYPERWFGTAKRQEEKVIDYLNEHLESPDYFLHINIASAPKGNPPFAQMCRFLQKELAQLDYDNVVHEAREREGIGLRRFPSRVWEHGSWTIEFRAIPKIETRGKHGI